MNSDKESSAFAALLLLILLAFAVALYGYSTRPASAQQGPIVEGLQLQSTSVHITGLSTGGLKLNLEAAVYDSDDFGVTLEAMNYSVYADGHYVGSGQTDQEYGFSPGLSQILVFPVNTSWKSAVLTTGSYIAGLGSVIWSVDTTANIEVEGYALTVSFEFSTG